MLEAGIYHKCSKKSLPSILAEGLIYGRQGRHSCEDGVPETNDLLNRMCPDELRSVGLDRHRCTYGYLAVDRWIFDVDSGVLMMEQDWHVEEGMVKLKVSAPPEIAFVSDLETYDELVHGIAEASEITLRKLAQEYWRRIVPLPDLCSHYDLHEHALVRRPDGPATLPSRLERVEVLLTADVAPEDLHPLLT